MLTSTGIWYSGIEKVYFSRRFRLSACFSYPEANAGVQNTAATMSIIVITRLLNHSGPVHSNNAVIHTGTVIGHTLFACTSVSDPDPSDLNVCVSRIRIR